MLSFRHHGMLSRQLLQLPLALSIRLTPQPPPSVISPNAVLLSSMLPSSTYLYVELGNILASDPTWNDEALTSQFRSGLSSEIKDLALSIDEPATLALWTILAIRLVNRPRHVTGWQFGISQHKAYLTLLLAFG